jgi:DNA-binding XRE family transcriptional regulator
MDAFAEFRLRVPAREAARVRSALGGLLPLIGEEARLAEVAPGSSGTDNIDMKAIVAEIEADDDVTLYPVESVIGTSTPGSLLRGLRVREGITPKELVEKLGIQQHHMSEMEKGIRKINLEMAWRISKAYAISHRVFLVS